MDTEIMPLALIAKLLGALALCFGVLVAAAWILRKQWPRWIRARGARPEEPGIRVLQSRGLSPGSALHLIEVDGSRVLLLQGKERSEVLWTRDEGAGDPATFEAEAELAARPALSPAPAAAPKTAQDAAPALPGRSTDDLSPEQLRLHHNQALARQRERQRRYRERRRQNAPLPGVLYFPGQNGARP